MEIPSYILSDAFKKMASPRDIFVMTGDIINDVKLLIWLATQRTSEALSTLCIEDGATADSSH